MKSITIFVLSQQSNDIRIMKTNGNEPAYPTTEYDNNGYAIRGFGLTKREQFAMSAMQAYAGADHVGNSGMPHEEIARWAVNQADALIYALNAE